MEKKNPIAQKIKMLRMQRGLSSKELAQKAEISISMLSQLENGLTQGSVETLRKITAVLDTTLAFLFLEEDEIVKNNSTEQKKSENFLVVRSDTRKKITFPDSKYSVQMLTPDMQGDIEFVLIEVEAGHTTDRLLPHTKGGEECVYVLEGTMWITLADEEYILYKGDSIRFDPSIPHKIENKGDEKLVQISAITPPSF